ncbi:hypothetical protein BJF88_07450 [Cellulosimicrobium sp. CUA-896]|nr:hypothetical protein BJF88_07450 [Cellulosimicrobium sp. CUA-896]
MPADRHEVAGLPCRDDELVVGRAAERADGLGELARPVGAVEDLDVRVPELVLDERLVDVVADLDDRGDRDVGADGLDPARRRGQARLVDGERQPADASRAPTLPRGPASTSSSPSCARAAQADAGPSSPCRTQSTSTSATPSTVRAARTV